jgi:hypothetical protein
MDAALRDRYATARRNVLMLGAIAEQSAAAKAEGAARRQPRERAASAVAAVAGGGGGGGLSALSAASLLAADGGAAGDEEGGGGDAEGMPAARGRRPFARRSESMHSRASEAQSSYTGLGVLKRLDATSDALCMHVCTHVCTHAQHLQLRKLK